MMLLYHSTIIACNRFTKTIARTFGPFQWSSASTQFIINNHRSGGNYPSLSPTLRWIIVLVSIQWNPDFTNLQGKWKLVRKIGEFEKLGVKLQCSTEEGKQPLVPVIGRFEKLRVQEIGISLYTTQAEWLANQNVNLCVHDKRSEILKSLALVVRRWLVLANHLQVNQSERTVINNISAYCSSEKFNYTWLAKLFNTHCSAQSDKKFVLVN